MEQSHTESLQKKPSFFSRVNNIFSGGMRLEDKISFARNLETMVRAGLPLSRGLSVLWRQSKNQNIRSVLASLGDDIAAGKSFHVALGAFPRVFPPLFVALIRAGEESGKLSDSLATVAAHLRESYELGKRIRGALLYPAVIVVAMVIIAIIMLLYVVPVLSATFEELGVDLPMSTRAVIAVSDFLETRTSLALGFFAAFLLLTAFTAHTVRGRRFFSWATLRLPLIGPIAKNVNTARTARTLSSLLSAGVPLVETLIVTEEVLQNPYYKDALREAKEKVEKGDQLSEIFTRHEDIYPLLIAEMTAVGEETGKLGTMLLEIALFYESEVERETRDISQVIEPFLMIIIGAAVGFFALSMITPMYTLVGSI